MALSSDLISQLVKVNKEPKKAVETTSYGTTVEYEGRTYVKLDGSDLLTPVNTTTSVKDGDRVTVVIKDHTATVTGNMTDPSASSTVVDTQGKQISEFEVIMAYKVTTEDLEAINATIENLRVKLAKFDNMEAVYAEIYDLEVKLLNAGHLTATDMEVVNAQIERLEVMFGEFKDISAEDLEAINAEIGSLKAYTADFTYISAEVLDAVRAEIKNADIKYANIDFSNIGEAAIEYLYAVSGLIKDVVINNGTITGNLVGVTIKGDLIEGGTVVADKLVIKGDDGLYYKLNTDGVTTETEQTEYNSLNGSIITAKSITATKISVDDLVAFDATIGGFNITETSIYSGVKTSVDNTTSGVYLDKDGQVAFGDSSNFLKYYKDDAGEYKLEISAESLIFSSSGKTVEERISENNSAIIQTTQSIIDSELDSCVDTSTYEDFKADINSRLEVLNNEVNIKFAANSDQVADADNNFQSFLATFSKFIRFASDTAITIGSGDSAITLEIDNDTGIVFKKNGVQFGWWDGVDFHTGNIVVEVNERAQLGNFAFIPRSDGSLSFRKVGG